MKNAIMENIPRQYPPVFTVISNEMNDGLTVYFFVAKTILLTNGPIEENFCCG